MRIDLGTMHQRYRAARGGKASGHSAQNRLNPSILQYDYLTLSTLAADIRELIGHIPHREGAARALDLGSSRSPYRPLLEARGYSIETLDLTPDEGADHVGTAEATGLPDASFDLVLCTQVLEHCMDPWRATAEIFRILQPGGHAIISVPHVWFFHPHPHDHWRFTQEGLVHLCRVSGLEPVLLLAQGGSILAGMQVLNFLLYGALGRWGAPLYAVSNLVGQALDRLAPNELFCHNFACLAQRGGKGTDGSA